MSRRQEKKPAFAKALVANRGEVALRVVRALREMGISSVVVHSEVDRETLPVLLADEAVCIGPGSAQQSYLNAARILSAAGITGAEAIHPGYGFLSENADFADAVASSGIAFIGPSAPTMRLLGDKIAARRRMQQAKVPVVPGSDGPLSDLRQASLLCRNLGFPVLIKAAAGGGGKGMRIIRSEDELEAGMRLCQAEAHRSFEDERVYVEKYLGQARHIEVQILADRNGTTVHLGERDCSAQRRHQKLLEESPAPGISPETRRLLGDWAVAAARAAGYEGAGTVEFICSPEGECYFMEMNARLQVEHPVTEMVTGVDIVQQQVRIAAGLPLTLAEPVGALRGHAVECRVYAEDPDADFRPVSGYVSNVLLPAGPGIRTDSALTPRCTVPSFYDPLIAKIVAWAPDRELAIARMDRALDELRIEGIPTTVGFLRRLLRSPSLQKGKVTTSMLDET
ncbi:acetyl-CoA carboxylase biotin carboxylase subunit [candidate division WOR-3 bacterium]|nr:acetyl-CoA carboxylase biotin carboxylase subunit [candidate division WOR-3 bacterium]